MSFLYLEIKYAKMVGTYLERFKITKELPYMCRARCPLCGDSEKDKRKARFHILETDGKLIYKCFNCDAGGSFTYFLKTNFPQLHNEYVFERYRSETTDAPVITTKPVDDSSFVPKQIKQPVDELFSLKLPYVRELDKTHPVARYVASRGLPDYPFQYAEKFYEFASEFNNDLNHTRSKDEPRLIIPFFDRKGNVFAFQGRDLLGKSKQKYITIVIDKKVPKIFGIDRVDFKKPVILVEGPIDSLFLPNCLASVNASLVSTAKKLSPVINKTQLTLVYDNEPRNFQITKMYSEAISEGYRVVIWPSSPDKKEDINDLTLAGKDVTKIIQNNTYSGLLAQLEFQKWAKCR